MEECGPCPVFATFTLAFDLQPRKKHGKTLVRVRKTSVRLRKTSVRVEYTYYQNTHKMQGMSWLDEDLLPSQKSCTSYGISCMSQDVLVFADNIFYSIFFFFLNTSCWCFVWILLHSLLMSWEKDYPGKTCITVLRYVHTDAVLAGTQLDRTGRSVWT